MHSEDCPEIDEVETNRVRRPCKFREADVRRAIRAARKENLLARIELTPDGRILIIPITGQNVSATIAPVDANEWDIAQL